MNMNPRCEKHDKPMFQGKRKSWICFDCAAEVPSLHDDAPTSPPKAPDAWTYFLSAMPPLGQKRSFICDYCHRHEKEHSVISGRCPIPNCTLQGGPPKASSQPALVNIETPFSGDVERNTRYARACLHDSISRGEAPIASHLLYTQPGVLDDTDADERDLGIRCGFAWNAKASKTVIYTDLGISQGMRMGIEDAEKNGRAIEYRTIGIPAPIPGLESAKGREWVAVMHKDADTPADIFPHEKYAEINLKAALDLKEYGGTREDWKIFRVREILPSGERSEPSKSPASILETSGLVEVQREENRRQNAEIEAIAGVQEEIKGPAQVPHLNQNIASLLGLTLTRWEQYLNRDSERPGSSWALEMLEKAEEAYRQLLGIDPSPAAPLGSQGGEEKSWIGVDFDGTLSHYEGWQGHEFDKMGPPIPAMMERIKGWLAEGQRVKIFTARAGIPEQIPAVEQWLAHHGLAGLEVTNIKDRFMYQLWDDRAIQVEINTGRQIKVRAPEGTQGEAGKP